MSILITFCFSCIVHVDANNVALDKLAVMIAMMDIYRCKYSVSKNRKYTINIKIETGKKLIYRPCNNHI